MTNLMHDLYIIQQANAITTELSISPFQITHYKQEVRVTYFPDLVQTFGVGRGTWFEMYNSIKL